MRYREAPMPFLTYLFWPNPGMTGYGNPKVLALLAISAGFFLASYLLRRWRSAVQNSVTKRLSRSWAPAAFWFGLAALSMTVARAEGVSFVSMRFWWVVWLLALALFLVVQVRLWRARHYEVLPGQQVEDPRAKYLPRKKK